MNITTITVPILPSKPACVLLSARGQVYANNHTVLHQYNNKHADCYILASQYDKIMAARIAIAELTSIELSDIRYSFPAMARQVCDWLGYSETLRNTQLRTDIIPVWHYQHCEPCEIPNQVIYDMRSAYWQIAAKAKSLACYVLPQSNKIVWLNVSRETSEKWERTKAALEPHKRLRLAIIGVNAVSTSTGGSMRYFCRGEQRRMNGSPPSWFNHLSLLTVRVAYELTQLQAREARTCYANADCVSCESSQAPHYWQDYGITYTQKGAGTLDAHAVGVWKCGGASTETYEYFERNHIDCLSEHIGYNYPNPIYHELYCQ